MTQPAAPRYPTVWRLSPVFRLLALGLLAAGLLVGPSVKGATAQDDSPPSPLLTESISGFATIALRNDQATVDEPLVVFYDAASATGIAPGSAVGTLVDGDRAVELLAVDCPPLNTPAGVMAVCLGVNELPPATGVYTG